MTAARPERPVPAPTVVERGPTRTAAARAARRSPTDLPFVFADRALAQALAAERDEPDWLRAERLEAFERFDALPIETNRLYTTYVDLRAAQLLDARPYVSTASEPAATLEPPADSDVVVELDEDGFPSCAISDAARSAGVQVETFGAALARDPDGFRELLSRSELPADDKLAQFGRAFWNQGLVVHVPDGVQLERPIVVRWLTGRPDRALITRTIVSLGRGASAALLEELGPSSAADLDGGQSLYTGTLELFLDEGASLGVASVQELPGSTVAFQHRIARIGASADLRWAIAHLGSRLVRSRVDNLLLGRGGSVEQVEIVFGGEEQLFDLTSYTRHRGEDTTGTITSKSAMLGSSRAFMKGLITIERSARGTDSFLGEFGMHLNRQARSVAIPSLEIDQPDVRRAAHSSSVGPIDESQVFYLETRGLPADLARKIVVLGFLEPVVARVPLADVQDRLRERLDEKWEDAFPASAEAA